MKRQPILDFFDISSNVEELPRNELFRLRGGYSDGTIDGGELPGVDVPPPPGSPDPDDDPWDWGGDDPHDGWEDDNSDMGGGSDTGGGSYTGGSSSGEPTPATPDDEGEKNENEQECTCELLIQPPSNLPTGISDPDSLLANLKTHLAQQTTFLMLNEAELQANGTLTEEGIVRTLDTLDYVDHLIHCVIESGMSFRIEKGTIDGGGGILTKDPSGQYVITLDTNGGYQENTLLVHELYHAFQVTTGEIGFDQFGNPTMVGMEDEIAAYQLQYNFEAGAGGTPLIATETGIKTAHPGIYDNLPSNGGSCPIHG